jgi:hypothetical protein
MNRRQWMGLAGRAGAAALLPGCAANSTGFAKINLAVAQRLGGDGYGIWQSGRWLGGRNLDLRLPSLSITKALAALAVVRATDEGWLQRDRPLVDVIPEWRMDPGKRRVTVRMLVNQTAGFSAGVAALYRGRIGDKGRVAIALPLVDPPGRQFRYGPASDEILAEVLRRYLRQRGSTTEQFLREMMGSIGISSPDWRKDVGGRFYLSGVQRARPRPARAGRCETRQRQRRRGIEERRFPKSRVTPRREPDGCRRPLVESQRSEGQRLFHRAGTQHRRRPSAIILAARLPRSRP